MLGTNVNSVKKPCKEVRAVVKTEHYLVTMSVTKLCFIVSATIRPLLAFA